MPRIAIDRRTSLILAGATVLAPLAALGATEPAFPRRPVRLIVAFTPGAAPDLLARALAAALSRKWNVPVVVENKLGADGVISADHVAKSAPDGHTLYLATMGNLALAPAMVDKLPYDAATAFRGVSFVAANPFAMLLRQDSPLRSVADLVSQSRKAPLNYGSAGTLGPLIGGLIAKRTGADLNYVPYKGAQPAITDLLGGQIDLVIADLPSLLPFQAKGQGRLLAVTTEQRAAQAPDVPTLAESGYKDFDFSTWYAVVAPRATPGDTVTQISLDVAEALKTAEVTRQLQMLGLSARPSTPDAMDALLRNELARWGALVRQQRR